MRKITSKAKAIYESTKRECRTHIKNWGYNLETDGGFNRMSTEECVYGRVMNDMKALLKSDLSRLAVDMKLDILTNEQVEFEAKVLTMVEKTMKNQYISGRKGE